jgi:hypothetical protein
MIHEVDKCELIKLLDYRPDVFNFYGINLQRDRLVFLSPILLDDNRRGWIFVCEYRSPDREIIDYMVITTNGSLMTWYAAHDRDLALKDAERVQLDR